MLALVSCLVAQTRSQQRESEWLSSDDGCPPGTHVVKLLSGERFCRWCAPGTYQPEPNAEACVPCRPGTVSGVIGASSASTCKGCARGTYAALDAAGCSPCPSNTESPSGAVEIGECTPLPGHYASRDGVDAVECPANHYCARGVRVPTQCPDGTFSPPGSEACTPGPPPVLLLDWIFVASWLVLVSSGVLTLGLYRNALRQGGAKEAGGVIKVQIVR